MIAASIVRRLCPDHLAKSTSSIPASFLAKDMPETGRSQSSRWTISIHGCEGLLGLPKDFVIHSLRHTLLNRLGEAGADAFTNDYADRGTQR